MPFSMTMTKIFINEYPVMLVNETKVMMTMRFFDDDNDKNSQITMTKIS